MNRPTPGPSQEGNSSSVPRHWLPSSGGVGGGFMAPTHVQFLEVSAFHEPYPLIPSFSPTGGEGARRAVEGDSDRFMASIQVRILEVSSAHEPLRYGS